MTPGVTIVDDPSPGGDGLPVMDVPVFIGFAQRGPCQRPVRVDDPAQFAAVFGGPLDLVEAAAGPQQGRVVAHLHAAVGAFFANGGRRCHVLRVAARSPHDWVEAGAAAGPGAGAGSTRFEWAGLRLALRGSMAGLAGASWHNGGGAWRWSNQDFELRAASPGTWADRLEGAARTRSQALHAGDAVHAGDLLRATRPAGPAAQAGWLRVDRTGSVSQALAAAAAADWIWPAGGAGVVDAQDWLVERVQVDLALRQAGGLQQRRDACGLSAGATNLPWWQPDDDAAYDAADDPGGVAAQTGWPLAGSPWQQAAAGFSDTSVDWVVLPLDATSEFTHWRTARHDGRDALARNGLDRFDASLFVDPEWGPRLRGNVLRQWADDVRFLAPLPRRLQGLHGALGRDDACAREVTWIIVPDAVQPGWNRDGALPVRNGVVQAVADPVCACLPRDFERCEPPPPQPPQAPTIDFGAPAPVALPADTDWQIALRPETPTPLPVAVPVPASRLQVQLASQSDFSDARELIDAQPPTALPPATLTLKLSAGVYFLRARSHRAGLLSPWSHVVTVDLRATGWRALPTGLLPLHRPEDSVCAQVQRALLDLCAASREHLALLTVPAQWDAPTLAAHVAGLRAHARAGDASAAAATGSFGALYHPWALQAQADGPAGGVLREHPPDGAVMGLMARRSRNKGAWSAAGMEPLAGLLQPAGKLVDAEAIESLGANPLQLRSGGLCATRSHTLSEDPDWESLGVRRLFILLRRLARREGERFAFEPNDLALRRSLERTFDALLQRLMQRGAFRGADAQSSFLLRTASGAQAAQEIERGECSLLIQVAPSRPLRFLTLHLLRAGEALQIEER